jgi:ATPase subunit of ABC transporter with duplicated ATPase domains
MERGAQVTAAKRRGVHEDRVSAQAHRLDAARAAQRVVRAIDVDVPETAVPAGKVVITPSALDLHAGGVRLWPAPVSFGVIGPERIALRGANGSGKSTLLRHLSERAQVRTAYLDQRLELLPEHLTLAEAMREAAPALAEHDRRVRLGRLGFEQERTEARIAILSGGERMRAALALLFVRPDPPQLLLLDEPETHLDLTSLDELVMALDGYHGALIVVSHDTGFVRAIGAGRTIELARGPGPR